MHRFKDAVLGTLPRLHGGRSTLRVRSSMDANLVMYSKLSHKVDMRLQVIHLGRMRIKP